MIQFGNDKIKEIYFGSEKIKEVYHGSDLVWTGKKPSYAILTDGTRVDFELENTTVANIVYGSSTANIRLNGTIYQRTNIKELIIGESYLGVKSIPHPSTGYTISRFENMTKLDLYGFSNVTTVGNYFGSDMTSLGTLDMSMMKSLASIGSHFVSRNSVSRIVMGATTPPVLNMYPFNQNTNLSEIIVPCESVAAYKSASMWSTKASIIKCEEVIDPETSFKLLPNQAVNWVNGYGHGEGLWSNGDELVLTSSNNKISAVMTDESFKITDYSKVRIKWSYSGVTAHANNVLRIEFRNNPNTNFNNRIRYDVTTNSATETLTINLASITNANLWDVSENYKVLFFAFGYTSTPVQVNIEEIIFIE